MPRWFHPNLGNVEAERLLLDNGSDGSFLVRPSKSCSGHFSLSIRRKDAVTHIKIRRIGEFYYLQCGQEFSTVPELIQFYTQNQLLDKKNSEEFKLKKPLLCSPGPITERWFHGPISGSEAEKLIRENGVSGSFLVRESQSNFGDYVVTVRIKDDRSSNDKVTHLIIRHNDNKYDVGGDKRFDSLIELVEHYKRNPIVESSGSVVIMKYPFNSTRITALDIDARIKELSKEYNQNNANNSNNNIASNDNGINSDNNHHYHQLILSCSGRDGFWEEFEHLQHQECKVLFDRKVAQEDKNLSKNRYKNILPFDYTRVILKRPMTSALSAASLTSSSSSSSTTTLTSANITTVNNNNSNNNYYSSAPQSFNDYINANYIKLVNNDTNISPRSKPVPHSKIYIATQGPLSNTVNDFWWMVWQENSDCIVMATKEIERGKNKCYRYWPTDEQKSLVFGCIEVKIVATYLINGSSKSQRPSSIPMDGSDDCDYIYREFDIRYISGKGGVSTERDENNDNYHMAPIRRVKQFQYLAWPDQNIPVNSISVLNFLREVNNSSPRGPMIVHCSAGIGRSGTLIVIDMLMDQLNHYGLDHEVDIQQVVKTVRAQRSGLVQTEAQYKFIYLAIQKYIASLSL